MAWSGRLRINAAPLVVASIIAAIVSVGAYSGPASADSSRGGSATPSWSLARDFRLSPNQANPSSDPYGNPRVWRYESAPIQSAGWPKLGRFQLLPVFHSNRALVEGLENWSGTEHQADNDEGLPTVAINATGEDTYLYDINWPNGVVILHPYDQEAVSVGWRSPINGYVRIRGTASLSQSPNCGSGTAWILLAGKRILRAGTVSDPDAVYRWGVRHLPVREHQIIRLVVGPNGDYYCDSTRLSLKITKVG